MKPEFPFPGTPSFNTIDYFLAILLFSVALAPLSCASRNRAFQAILHICLGSLCLFSVAPRLLFFYIALWIVVYALIFVAKAPVSGALDYAKIFIPTAAVLSPMVWWKLDPLGFEHFLNIDVNALIWRSWPKMGEIDSAYMLVAPLGLSFSVFRAVDLLVESYLDVIERPRFVQVMAYGLFAPVQIVGPIIQFREIELIKEGARLGAARWGALQIAIGLAKVFVFALPLSWSGQIAGVFSSQSIGVMWASLAVLPLFLFLNFSGFSDISIGTAAIYGYRLMPNFNYPLLRSSLQQFWSNWHMSLTKFAQRNVFVPLGGYRKERQYFAILATMMVIALWHNLSIALVLFGALHGGALVLGRIVRGGAAVRAADGDQTWRRYVCGWAATYVFLALTIPLLLLRDGDILHFYAALIDLR